MNEVYMDIGSKNKGAAGRLSNFTPRPFIFKGVQCNSMEGLLQSFKFKSPDMQVHCCTLTGFAAKSYGSNKPWQRTQTLWWQGHPIARDSEEYQKLLDDAYDALFTNEKAKKTLLSTGTANLTHSIGRIKSNETILTRQEFCSRLMRVRKELNE